MEIEIFSGRNKSLPQCPNCLKLLDAFTGTASQPKEGDVNVCAYCGELLLFNADQSVRRPTPAELQGVRQRGDWPLINRIMQEMRYRG